MALFYARFFRDPIGVVGDRFARYGDVYRVTQGDTPLFVVRHPEHIHEVLVAKAAHYDKQHSAFKALGAILGSGLLTSDGAEWARHRRMMTPVFARGRMGAYASVMVDEAEALLRDWRPGTTRDLGRDMAELTLRIVGRTLFSHDASRDAARTRAAMATFHDVIGGPLPDWVRVPGRPRVSDAVSHLDAILFEMIAARRARGAAGASPDLLDLLLAAEDSESGGGLTDREIRDEVLTLFLAGHETTAHALTWTFILLAQHPEVARALHTELDQALPAGRAPTHEDLERLPYTSAVLKESMRLFPPAYTLARRAITDTAIGPYRVPSGSEVVVWLYMTHHDARWFPEPERFDPERFSREAEAKLPRLAYLPFGAGGRACIGRAFAMMEATLLLATLARARVVALASVRPVRPKLRITMFPKGRVRVHVGARGPL